MFRIMGVLALGVLLAGCDTPLSASSRSVKEAPSVPAIRVDIVNQTGSNPYAFRPGQITVSVGSRVTWHNGSTQDHTVTTTGADPDFNSGTQKLIHPGADWSYVFQRAGTYRYYCVVHPYMKGTVLVQR